MRKAKLKDVVHYFLNNMRPKGSHVAYVAQRGWSPVMKHQNE